MTIEENIWSGLYGESWKGLICDDAFAHPAKYSRALIRAIYDHVVAEGWATKGDSVVDPFGGVALGSFDAMRHGLNYVGVELEAKFVGLGNQNIAQFNERFSRMPNWGTATLLNGDSRKLAEVLRGADCCVSSPPYIEPCGHGGGKGPLKKEKSINEPQYGRSVGQISEMPEGDHSIAISSPPYVSGGHHNDIMGAWNANGRGQGVTKSEAGYGRTEGQLGAMPEGHALAVSSPPFMDNNVNIGAVGDTPAMRQQIHNSVKREASYRTEIMRTISEAMKALSAKKQMDWTRDTPETAAAQDDLDKAMMGFIEGYGYPR